jgi:DNA-binding GntR family transcriptional regulator
MTGRYPIRMTPERNKAASKAKLRLVKPRSRAEFAQGEIEKRIVSGALAPGERVNENALAGALGISRGPVREACKALAEAGLLTIIANRGCFVREVSRQDAIEVYDLRTCLMRHAGSELAGCITPAQLAELSDQVAAMDAAATAGDFDAFYALNRAFHDNIVAFAGNRRLRALSEGLAKELHLYRRRSLVSGGGFAVSNREHKEILAALEARDAARAGAAMENHILAGKARFLAAAEVPAAEREGSNG